MVRECYSETTKVAWCKFDTVELLKTNNPISWQIAMSEHATTEEENERIVSFDNGTTYYAVYDLEILLG
tara:strand:- start:167221 stop:167427 length:207 start_codon:yes stop_codon:yes gene_type:complete